MNLSILALLAKAHPLMLPCVISYFLGLLVRQEKSLLISNDVKSVERFFVNHETVEVPHVSDSFTRCRL